jgi:hypothetical protein
VRERAREPPKQCLSYTLQAPKGTFYKSVKKRLSSVKMKLSGRATVALLLVGLAGESAAVHLELNAIAATLLLQPQRFLDIM